MFEADGDYSNISLSSEDLRDVSADGAAFTDCRFQAVAFSDASLVRASFERCTFAGCDLSNVDLSDSAIDSVVFRDSKLLGASFAEASLRNVQVSGCLARLVSFFQASLRSTAMLDCDLSEADFRDGRLIETALARCDLSSVSFERADVRQLDLRGSMLNGSFSLADAKGFVVGTDQLLVLARALARDVGARVSDDQVPGLEELPGAGDPGIAQRGLREARAWLGQG